MRFRPDGRVLTVPNMLSTLRLLLVPVFAVLIISRHQGWAVLVLSISGATDYLDGWLARRFGQVSRLGQMLDPVADRLYVVTTLVGLGYVDAAPWWLVGALIARDGVLTLTVPVLARAGSGPLEVTYLGKAATFNLLFGFPMLLLGSEEGAVPHFFRALGWGFTWWGTALYFYTGLVYLGQVRGVVRRSRSAGELSR